MHKKTARTKSRKKRSNLKRPGAGENVAPFPEDVWEAGSNFIF